MRKHATVNLDRDLVGEAAEILGTSSTISTVHAALAQVVERDKRSWLARYPLPDLTPEALGEQRRVRRPE
jgi:Arc/MetJ family transcription regulator